MNEYQKKLYKNDIEILKRVVNQQKTDKNKSYSVHKPFTKCIAKGKVHKAELNIPTQQKQFSHVMFVRKKKETFCSR